mgnify:CR=1 FL=1
MADRGPEGGLAKEQRALRVRTSQMTALQRFIWFSTIMLTYSCLVFADWPITLRDGAAERTTFALTTPECHKCAVLEKSTLSGSSLYYFSLSLAETSLINTLCSWPSGNQLPSSLCFDWHSTVGFNNYVWYPEIAPKAIVVGTNKKSKRFGEECRDWCRHTPLTGWCSARQCVGYLSRQSRQAASLKQR